MALRPHRLDGRMQSSPSTPPEPLVSIIVATFNRGGFLERCLRSILDQTYRNLECIVVDGASQDQSLDILKRVSTEDPRLRFISEPDKGEVYAVNKGLDLARGDIIGFQASDDFYVLDAVRTSVDYLLAHPEYTGVAGDARFVDPTGQPLGRGMITYRGELSGQHVRRILILRFLMCPVVHGTFFGWRERLLRHGKLDPAFSVVPDVDYYTRLLAGGERIGCLPRFQVNYTVHPDMGAVKYYQRVRSQLAQIYTRYGFRWYHHALRLTVGRLASYLGNPYRTPLRAGLVREAAEFWRMKVRKPQPN
jgi:glycosyltransferase involved in cell wall biosynthesis